MPCKTTILTRLKPGIHAVAAAAFAILFLNRGCTPLGCIESTDTFVRGSFYMTGTGTSRSPDSLSLYGWGMDSAKIHDNQKNVAKVKIPLDAGSASCRFVMKINGIPDTITFVYSTYPHLVSKECGYTYFHTLESIVNTREDVDIIISNRKISLTNEENIRIFY